MYVNVLSLRVIIAMLEAGASGNLMLGQSVKGNDS